MQLPIFAGSPTLEQLALLEQITYTEFLLRARAEPALGVRRLRAPFPTLCVHMRALTSALGLGRIRATAHENVNI